MTDAVARPFARTGTRATTGAVKRRRRRPSPGFAGHGDVDLRPGVVELALGRLDDRDRARPWAPSAGRAAPGRWPGRTGRGCDRQRRGRDLGPGGVVVRHRPRSRWRSSRSRRPGALVLTQPIAAWSARGPAAERPAGEAGAVRVGAAVGPLPPQEPSFFWLDWSQATALLTAVVAGPGERRVRPSSASTANAVVSVSGVSLAATQPCAGAATAAKLSRNHPSGHCCWSRKDCTLAALALLAPVSASLANAWPIVLAKSPNALASWIRPSTAPPLRTRALEPGDQVLAAKRRRVGPSRLRQDRRLAERASVGLSGPVVTDVVVDMVTASLIAVTVASCPPISCMEIAKSTLRP